MRLTRTAKRTVTTLEQGRQAKTGGYYVSGTYTALGLDNVYTLGVDVEVALRRAAAMGLDKSKCYALAERQCVAHVHPATTTTAAAATASGGTITGDIGSGYVNRAQYMAHPPRSNHGCNARTGN